MVFKLRQVYVHKGASSCVNAKFVFDLCICVCVLLTKLWMIVLAQIVYTVGCALKEPAFLVRKMILKLKKKHVKVCPFTKG